MPHLHLLHLHHLGLSQPSCLVLGKGISYNWCQNFAGTTLHILKMSFNLIWLLCTLTKFRVFQTQQSRSVLFLKPGSVIFPLLVFTGDIWTWNTLLWFSHIFTLVNAHFLVTLLFNFNWLFKFWQFFSLWLWLVHRNRPAASSFTVNTLAWP